MKISQSLVALGVAALLSACGGGDSAAPSVKTGVFGNSPVSSVSGISYKTATQLGTTNTEGKFSYLDNEDVTFSIGSIQLPKVAAKAQVTPLDMSNTPGVEDQVVSNILALLQSLDADSVPANGISIPATALTNIVAIPSFDVSPEAFATVIKDSGLAANSGVSVAVPVEVIATPTTPTYPATAETAGTLPTTAFTSDLTGSAQSVTISGSGASSVMTFSSPAFTLTGATTSNPTWNGVYGGQVRADGNVVAACTTGQRSTPLDGGTADLVYQLGTKIFISSNLVPVTDAKELYGKTLYEFDCAGANGNSSDRFNANGTMTHTDSFGVTILNANEVSAYLSTAGFAGPDGNGSNYKASVYKYTVGSVSSYFTVILNTQVKPAGTYVSLGAEAN